MPRDYDSIIEFENEHTALDFKAVQYEKASHAAMLLDVVAMANADLDGERMIIVGVKHEPNGERAIVPIDQSEFVDAATYQELVRDNVEPDLLVTYEPYRYKGQLLGILKLVNCDDPPYMLKKESRHLKRGECVVRKGTHNTRATRVDFDKMYERRARKKKFSGMIAIGFRGTEFSKEIEVFPAAMTDLPSEEAAASIRRILAEKKRQRQLQGAKGGTLAEVLEQMPISPFFVVPYEKRSILTLEYNLARVKETYADDDLYEVFEKRAFRLNLEILNISDEYLLDATVVIETVKDDSFHVSDEIAREPHDEDLLAPSTLEIPYFGAYPSVEHVGSIIRISEHVGDVRHKMRTKVFKEDLRLTVFAVPESGAIPLTVTVFAKNLAIPIERKLVIKVQEHLPQPEAMEPS